jgi:hypothetical protein
MKRFLILTVGLGLLLLPLCVQGEELPADGQETFVTAYGMKKAYDDRGDNYRTVGPGVEGKDRVLGEEDFDIDRTNAVLGGDCDIDCTTAEHGTDY